MPFTALGADSGREVGSAGFGAALLKPMVSIDCFGRADCAGLDVALGGGIILFGSWTCSERAGRTLGDDLFVCKGALGT